MSIGAWWPRLAPSTREWLIENNGDIVPSAIIEEIAAAGGPVGSDDWWVGQDESAGLCMPDEAIGWIEEIANGEAPANSDRG